MNVLSQAGLCEGYGGLTMAVRTVLGARLAWYAEHEPATRQNPRPTQAAARLLAHHHPGVPNLGDLTLADWEAALRVDILTGGWPCQPFSLAGQRKGAEDERAIWPYVADAIRVLRPRLVFLENVAAIAPAGELARAIASLAALGYVGSWVCLRADEVGAPHRRERIFILAWLAADAGSEAGELRSGLRPDGTTAVRWARPGHGAVAAADTSSDGRGEGRPEPARLVGRPDAAQRSDAAPAHAHRIGLEDGDSGQTGSPAQEFIPDWAGYTAAVRRWEHVLGRPAPAPTVLGRRGGRQLSPLFVEWMMGLPEGHVTAVPGLTRSEQLKLLGNGVVLRQAEVALRLLLSGVTAGVAA